MIEIKTAKISPKDWKNFKYEMVYDIGLRIRQLSDSSVVARWKLGSTEIFFTYEGKPSYQELLRALANEIDKIESSNSSENDQDFI